MDLKIVYLIWPDGESPDKCYSFTSVVVFDQAREELDKAGVKYGHAVIPLLGDDQTLEYLRNEMLPQGETK